MLRWTRATTPKARRTFATACACGLLIVLAGVALGLWRTGLLVGVASVAVLSTGFIFAEDSRSRVAREAQALWALSGLVATGEAWPKPGGWALSAEAIQACVSEVWSRSSTSLVELGPGVSTLAVARACPELHIYGVEHDLVFFRQIEQMLRDFDINNVTLVYAPLEQTVTNGGSVLWYSAAPLKALPETFDALVIDGPPNWDGAGHRAPASRLIERLVPEGLILVDDANRRSERKMVRQWVKDGLCSLVRDSGDFLILERTK